MSDLSSHRSQIAKSLSAAVTGSAGSAENLSRCPAMAVRTVSLIENSLLKAL
jgi:hypothetical protein